MLHVISARCVARDLHTIAPGPLERRSWRRFAALRGDCKKYQIAPLNAIIIIISCRKRSHICLKTTFVLKHTPISRLEDRCAPGNGPLSVLNTFCLIHLLPGTPTLRASFWIRLLLNLQPSLNLSSKRLPAMRKRFPVAKTTSDQLLPTPCIVIPVL